MENKRQKATNASVAGEKTYPLVLKHCDYLNVFTSQWLRGDIAICDGRIVGVGSYAGEREIDLPKGSLFSVLGLSPLSGLFIGNVRYPLADFSLPFGSSRTISNVAEGPVSLSLASGRAILIARPYDLSGA